MENHDSPDSYQDANEDLSDSESDLEIIPSLSDFKECVLQNRDRSNIQQLLCNGIKIKYFDNEREYIEGKWEDNKLVELYSAQFLHPKDSKTILYIRKQNAGYLFTIDDENLILRIKINKIEVLFSDKFTIGIKQNLLNEIVLITIFDDKLLNDRNVMLKKFYLFLKDRFINTAESLKYAKDLFQFFINLEKFKGDLNFNLAILNGMAQDEHISEEIRQNSLELHKIEEALLEQRKMFLNWNQFYMINLFEELSEIYNAAKSKHENDLNEKYTKLSASPLTFTNHIKDLDEGLLLFISNNDIELFSDLISTIKIEKLLEFIRESWDLLFARLRSITNKERLRNFAPLIHPVFLYLCKSFQEIIFEINKGQNVPLNDFLIKNQEIWEIKEDISNPNGSLKERSLINQYKCIFELLQHFQPNYSTKRKEFNYNSQLLEKPDHLKTIYKRFKEKLFGNSSCAHGLPEDRIIWIYIADGALGDLLTKPEVALFKPLFKNYVTFIEKEKYNNYELMRIVTHNIIKFIIHVQPYFLKQRIKEDEVILHKQLELFNKFASEEQLDQFRDLIDVCNEYWTKRENIIENIPSKFSYGKFKNCMEDIKQKLLDILKNMLIKEINMQELINCLRCFNEFLDDVSSLEFDWFIKNNNKEILKYITSLSSDIIKPININKNSCKVLNPEAFIKVVCNNIPAHYIIEIISALIDSIIDVQKRNRSNNVVNELILAIRKSFLYLKEQPDYLDFDLFKKESIEPFTNVIRNSESDVDFIKRVGVIGESFWYLRKQNEISIEKALELYTKSNENIDTEVLKNCYTKYIEKFDYYIKTDIDKTDVKRIELIIEKLKDQLEWSKINKTKFSDCSRNLKRQTIPELLAGLAAVWSIQESKDCCKESDNIDKRKMLQPHCIQILCIFRLLNVDDNSAGIKKHLAEVLTGQGKSLILALLSTLLTLLNYKIRIVCYSEYLAKRDQQGFNKFYETFKANSNIMYGTFDDMANDMLNPKINGIKTSLRKLTENRIFHHDQKQTGEIKKDDVSNTILLIDEVDVFFSEEFYGNTYNPGTRPMIPALTIIQEEIWIKAKRGYDERTILLEIDEFIKKKQNNSDFKTFKEFVSNHKNYELLEKENGEIVVKEYKNMHLFEKHLNEMVKTAIKVADGKDKNMENNRFKIDDDGFIIYKEENGIYSRFTWNGYYNTFHYFRLRDLQSQTTYDDRNGKNYGYLDIDCGKISYAKLPEIYPLILGVSGTLMAMNDYEKAAVKEHYNINEFSKMPSFFGETNLKFDSKDNFVILDSVQNWQDIILKHVSNEIESERSVIIFFENDTLFDGKLKEKFVQKFYRLQILTENTKESDKKKYIDEAGIMKTVTLATKGMGRGVDYKTSAIVEKNGGIHVIQTFVSFDIKEETQIKGRTARKDNQGSYEIILCKQHLLDIEFINEEDSLVNYEKLNKIREDKMKSKSETNVERIKKSEKSHETTMNFYGIK